MEAMGGSNTFSVRAEEDMSNRNNVFFNADQSREHGC